MAKHDPVARQLCFRYAMLNLDKVETYGCSSCREDSEAAVVK